MHRALSLALLALAACGSTPVQPPPDPELLFDLEAAAFPAAERVLAGFDAAAGARGWQSDDGVLFGLRLRRGGEENRWLLHLDVVVGDLLRTSTDGTASPIEVLFPKHSWEYTTTTFDGVSWSHKVESRMLMVGVDVLDADDGRRLGHSTVLLPADLLDKGLLAATQSAPALRASKDVDEALRLMRGEVEAWLAAVSLLHVVQSDSVLAEYFWQVVEKPGWWSVLTSFGVEVVLDVQFEMSVPLRRGPAHLPALGDEMVVPVRIDVNGSPALFADVLVGQPQRPFGLCGGLRAAAARHPTDGDVRFDLVLLAARCGGDAAER